MERNYTPNFDGCTIVVNGCTVVVWEWIINFIPHFTTHMWLLIHPCWDSKLIYVSKRGRALYYDLAKLGPLYLNELPIWDQSDLFCQLLIRRCHKVRFLSLSNFKALAVGILYYTCPNQITRHNIILKSTKRTPFIIFLNLHFLMWGNVWMFHIGCSMSNRCQLRHWSNWCLECRMCLAVLRSMSAFQ